MDELDLLLRDTQSFEVVSLSTDESSLKTQFLRRLSRHVTKNLGTQFHILDFDLQFSSYLNNLVAIEGIGDNPHGQMMKILQPRETFVEDSISKLASDVSLRPKGIMVIDSINTLQAMVRNPQSDTDSAIANHKASILITILQETVRYFSKSLWIISIRRERPKTLDSGSISWERELVGGRMLSFKSEMALSLHSHSEGTQGNSEQTDQFSTHAVINVEKVSSGRTTGRIPKNSYDIELLANDRH